MLAILAGFLAYRQLSLSTQHHPLRIGVSLALVAGAAWFLRDYFAYDSPAYHRLRPLIPGLAVLAAFCLFGFLDGMQTRKWTLEPYCKYGAVSQAQLNGCMAHVNTNEIDKLDTNAARFARGQLNECLRDSGPYCDDTWEDLE